jgi:ectoine hydroxylase-related dioxygenase (phytanoyl-CoA dioxygenase family)
MTGSFTDAERYRFDLQGFLVRRNVLSLNEVADLNDAVHRLGVQAPNNHDIMSQRFSGHLARHPAFVALLDHPAVIDLVTELCGATARLDHAYGIVMDPGNVGLDLHGGGHVWDHAQYYAVDRGGIHTGLVAVQWAISGSRPGDGGFACVPGSHKAAFRPPTGIGLTDPLVTEVPLGAGDVVIFTEALMHGTLPWRGANQRRTLLYKYSPGSSSWTNDHEPPVGLPMGALTTRQQRLFQKPSVAHHQPLS